MFCGECMVMSTSTLFWLHLPGSSGLYTLLLLAAFRSSPSTYGTSQTRQELVGYSEFFYSLDQFGSIWISLISMEHPDWKHALVLLVSPWHHEFVTVRLKSNEDKQTLVSVALKINLDTSLHREFSCFVNCKHLNTLQFRYGKHWRIKFFVGSTSLAWKHGGLLTLWGSTEEEVTDTNNGRNLQYPAIAIICIYSVHFGSRSWLATHSQRKFMKIHISDHFGRF